VIAEQLLSLEYPLDLLDLLDGNPRRAMSKRSSAHIDSSDSASR